MEESGREQGIKRLKIHEEKEEDRISALPDSIVQRILSNLPSIKEAIRCGILSKRWRDQWARLPVLILDPTGMSDENFFKFTKNILISYDCFKINKFYIRYLHTFKQDPHFLSKIRLATRRNVKDLTLSCFCVSGKYMLPEFLFSYASLVRLQTVNCTFTPNGSVNWRSLKHMSLYGCTLPNKAMQSVLSGSPLLETLVLYCCDAFGQPVIASKSLKELKVVSRANLIHEISCPELQRLVVEGSGGHSISFSSQALEKVLSTCQLLKSLKLYNCDVVGHIVIASESLRRLFLKSIKASSVEISCPNLEEMEFLDVGKVHWRRSSGTMHP